MYSNVRRIYITNLTDISEDLCETFCKNLFFRNIINNQAYWYDHGDKLAVKKTSSSRIPIPITSKSSSTDIHIEGADKINAEGVREPDYNKSCPNLFGSQNLEARSMEESKVIVHQIEFTRKAF